jgi:hypothetical protein
VVYVFNEGCLEMKIYSIEEHVENNCTECVHFESYYHAYEDDEEPVDQGFCRHSYHDDGASAEKTCKNFKRGII